MITDKQIEEAARKISSKVSLTDGFDIIPAYNEGYFDGFKASAHWAIEEFLKGLWHDAEEEPKSDTLILACIELGRTHQHVYEVLYFYKNWELDDIEDNYLAHAKVTRWLYIDDLLPKKDERICSEKG